MLIIRIRKGRRRLETSGRSAVPVVRSPAGARPSGPERALSGAPAAIRLFREVTEFATDPTRPLRAVVCGPGGSGKSVLLGLLADALRGAGVTVVDDAENAVDPDPNVVVLLDDVHELDEPTLGALRRGLARPTVRVIVAHRPLSGQVGPAALLRAVQVGGTTVVLGPLGRAGVADRAALLLGGHPDPALVGHVFQQTRGLPRLVDRLLTGLRDGGPGPGADRPVSTTSVGSADAPPEPRPIGVPGAVLRQIRADVDAHPVDLRRLVLSRALGAAVDPAVLAPVLDMPPDAAATLVDHGVAAGLLLDDGSLPPLVRLAVLGGGGVAHRAALHRRIAAVRLELGGDVSDLAHSLIGTGLHGREIAAVLERAADDALLRGRPGADDLYDAAVEAGTPAPELADRRAEAALLSGDLDAAMAAADQVLGNWSGAGTERLVRAVKVAAAVLAHRGLLARSAELHRWLAGRPGAGPAVAAVPALIGTGALAEAEEILGSAGAGDGGPPTALAGAEALLARGAHQAVVGAPTAALSDLARAAALAAPSGRSVLLADTPAALGAVVALHCGELDVAESVMERAIGSGLGGPVALPRHRLLQAWIAMQRGDTGQARTLAATVPDPSGTTGRLEPRDELMAAALEVALARRSGDLAALLASWGRAREAVVRHPVDLYSLLPLGELLVGAARLRQEEWVRPVPGRGAALLARLGEPAAVGGAAALVGPAGGHRHGLGRRGRAARRRADRDGGLGPVRRGAGGRRRAVAAGARRRRRRGGRRDRRARPARRRPGLGGRPARRPGRHPDARPQAT